MNKCIVSVGLSDQNQCPPPLSPGFFSGFFVNLSDGGKPFVLVASDPGVFARGETKMNEVNPIVAVAVVENEDQRLLKLAAEIKAENAAEIGCYRKGLDHAHNQGDKLLQAQYLCKVLQRNWTTWLAKNVDMSSANAYNYMNIASNWEKVKECATMAEARKKINPPKKKPDVKLQEITNPADPLVNPPVVRQDPKRLAFAVDELQNACQAKEGTAKRAEALLKKLIDILHGFGYKLLNEAADEQLEVEEV